jgi:L-amino acid N-acyltransferase YncA/2-polyprenyl-3-methyl-5-hydroxy-6-metoxy-1,4-benzoquinol methylase
MSDPRDDVRERYARAAVAVGCGSEPCIETGDRFGSALYGEELAQLPPDAVAASLGCGNPFAMTELAEGEVVLDLGSGGGIDVILSARRVGPSGKAYGLDMTPEMLALSRANATEAGVDNVEFLEGYMEDMPLPDASVDVVLSNCVVNLSPDKPAVFSEIARVLRPGGRIAISDVVLDDDAPAGVRADDVECVSTALPIGDHRRLLSEAGLRGVTIETTHEVDRGAWGAIIRGQRPLTASGDVTVRRMLDSDWDAVAAIYAAGIATGGATFETAPPTYERWNDAHRRDLRFVAADAADVPVGWVAASPVSERCVDGGVVEHGVYVDAGRRGEGIGRLLLDTLIEQSEKAGIWTVQTGIFPENRASLALHHACGFRTVGTRERVGQLDGRWRDVVLVERRSPAIV